MYKLDYQTKSIKEQKTEEVPPLCTGTLISILSLEYLGHFSMMNENETC